MQDLFSDWALNGTPLLRLPCMYRQYCIVYHAYNLLRRHTPRNDCPFPEHTKEPDCTGEKSASLSLCPLARMKECVATSFGVVGRGSAPSAPDALGIDFCIDSLCCRLAWANAPICIASLVRRLAAMVLPCAANQICAHQWRTRGALRTLPMPSCNTPPIIRAVLTQRDAVDPVVRRQPRACLSTAHQ